MPCKLIHGIDLTQINRSEFSTPGFSSRVLSTSELQEFETDSNKNKFIAVRWAIKEAIIKAISPNIIGLNDITITKDDCIYKWINHPAWIKDIVISTSIEQDVVIASVFGVRTDKQ